MILGLHHAQITIPKEHYSFIKRGENDGARIPIHLYNYFFYCTDYELYRAKVNCK